MGQEVKELEDQECWELVDLPQGKVLLGGRWVYKTKTDSKGNIVRYKARWVAQGYNQVLGIDYLETFSTTIRPETYRLFLALALQNGWIIRQYDVKLAFIHSPIDKEIYIMQPIDRKSTRLNSSHSQISYAVFCL